MVTGKENNKLPQMQQIPEPPLYVKVMFWMLLTLVLLTLLRTCQERKTQEEPVTVYICDDMQKEYYSCDFLTTVDIRLNCKQKALNIMEQQDCKTIFIKVQNISTRVIE